MISLGNQIRHTSSLPQSKKFMSGSTTNTITLTNFHPVLPGFDNPESTNIENKYDCHYEDSLEYCSSESQEEDILPAYECTLIKKGVVYIKHEIDATGVYSAGRKWNQVFLSVVGTKVTADYGSKSKRRPSLLASLGLDFTQKNPHRDTRNLPSYTQDIMMEGAILLPAREYVYTKPFTFRVLLASGRQFLIRSGSAESAVDWVEALQSAISISSDLELRDEPQFNRQSIIYMLRRYL